MALSFLTFFAESDVLGGGLFLFRAFLKRIRQIGPPEQNCTPFLYLKGKPKQ